MPLTLSSRPAVKAGYETICRFPQTVAELFFIFPRGVWPPTAGELEAAAATRSAPTVVLAGDRIAGYANLCDVRENRGCAVGNVIVAPRFRNRGGATFLIRTMEGIAAGKYRAGEMRLACFGTNTAALLLYAKLGYEPYEIEPRTARDGEMHALTKLRRKLR